MAFSLSLFFGRYSYRSLPYVAPAVCVADVTVVAVRSSLHLCLAIGGRACSWRSTDRVVELTNSTIQRTELNTGH